jgi:hypothetical protein
MAIVIFLEFINYQKGLSDLEGPFITNLKLQITYQPLNFVTNSFAKSSSFILPVGVVFLAS